MSIFILCVKNSIKCFIPKILLIKIMCYAEYAPAICKFYGFKLTHRRRKLFKYVYKKKDYYLIEKLMDYDKNYSQSVFLLNWDTKYIDFNNEENSQIIKFCKAYHTNKDYSDIRITKYYIDHYACINKENAILILDLYNRYHIDWEYLDEMYYPMQLFKYAIKYDMHHIKNICNYQNMYYLIKYKKYELFNKIEFNKKMYKKYIFYIAYTLRLNDNFFNNWVVKAGFDLDIFKTNINGFVRALKVNDLHIFFLGCNKFPIKILRKYYKKTYITNERVIHQLIRNGIFYKKIKPINMKSFLYDCLEYLNYNMFIYFINTVKDKEILKEIKEYLLRRHLYEFLANIKN